MSVLTLVGASGGVGVTTLTAASIHLMNRHGAGILQRSAADTAALDVRLGSLAPAPPTRRDEIVDGGRYSAAAAEHALRVGRLIVVGSRTPDGDLLLDAVLADVLARFGRAGAERVLPVQCASHGKARARRDRDMTLIPFDAGWAAGGPLATPRGAARAALDRAWMPLLRGVFTG